MARTLTKSVRWKKIQPRFLATLDAVVKAWEIQQREEEERRAKEDSIYVYKYDIYN